MGLFDQIASAIDSPNQQASSSQLSSIVSTVEQLSGSRGVDSSTTQMILSVVGRQVRSALQQKRVTTGDEQAEAIVSQYSGTSPSPRAVQDLFTPQQQQQTVQETAQKTGLNFDTIQSMLPILVPLVLKFLQTGASTQHSQGSNSVLSSFLDADNDGDVDIGDTMSLAGRFLKR